MHNKILSFLNRKVKNTSLLLILGGEILFSIILLKYLTIELGNDFALYVFGYSLPVFFGIDFLIGFTFQRLINNNEDEKPVLLGYFFKIYVVINLIFLVFFCLIFIFINNIFIGLTTEELNKLRIIYFFFVFKFLISYPFSFIGGLLLENNRKNLLMKVIVLQKILSLFLITISLIFKLGLYGVVIADFISSLIVIVILFINLLKQKKVKLKFKFTDKDVKKKISQNALFPIINSFLTRVPFLLLPLIISITQSSLVLSNYGITISFYILVNIFFVIEYIYLIPRVVNFIETNDILNINTLTSKVAKVNLLVTGLFLILFILFGNEFIIFFLEPKYSGAYVPTILMFIGLTLISPFITQKIISFSHKTIRILTIINVVFLILLIPIGLVGSHFFGLNGLIGLYLGLWIIKEIVRLYFVYRKNKELFQKNIFILYGKSLLLYLFTFVIGLLLKRALIITSLLALFVALIGVTFIYLLIAFIFYFKYDERDFLFSFLQKHNLLTDFIHRYKIVDDRTGVPIVFASILIVFALFSSNYPLVNVSLFSLIIFFIIAFCLYIYYVFPFKTKNKKLRTQYLIKNTGFMFLLVFILSAMVSFFVTKSYIAVFGYTKLILFLISAFIFTELYEFKVFANIFKKAFFVLSFISLFFTSLIIFYGVNFSLFIPSANYYNYYYLFFKLNGDAYYGRTTSLFWEPGIYASFSLFALTLTLIDGTSFKNKIPYLIMFSISLLTTQSLAGYLLIGLMFPLALNRIKRKPRLRYLSWVFTIGYMLGLILFIPFYSQIAKIIPAIGEKGLSLTTRIYSFNVDMEVYLRSPIFGVGYKYGILFYEIARDKYAGLVDVSINTFGYYIAAFGLVGFLLPIFLFGSLFRVKDFSLNDQMTLAILIILIFSKEPHTLSLISLILVFYIFKNGYLLNFRREDVNNSYYSLYKVGKLKNEK